MPFILSGGFVTNQYPQDIMTTGRKTDNTTLKIISNITVTLSAAVFFVQLAQKLTEIAVALL